MNAQKKEVEDTDALIERYRREIEDLKKRLGEREREVEFSGLGLARGGSIKRRLSLKEVCFFLSLSLISLPYSN